MAWIGQSAAARFAASSRFGGRLFHVNASLTVSSRCGFSANVHDTSIRRSSNGMFACVAHDASTENVHTASELPSMWNGEYCRSAESASIVSRPGAAS